MSIKSIIIDDEPLAHKSLTSLIQKHTNDVVVLRSCLSLEDGVQAIREFSPELVFLDIEMSGRTSFEMLDSLDEINFQVVFVSAHERYAVKSYSFEALDFILKPTGPEELIRAVNRFRKRKALEEKLEQKMGLVKSMSIMNTKIPLPDKDGVGFLEIGEVIRFEAEGSYVTIYSVNERPHVISKPLKYYATMLSEDVFIRVHRSHLVNIKFIRGFKREGGGYVVLANGEMIEVAEKKREMVIRKLSYAQ